MLFDYSYIDSYTDEPIKNINIKSISNFQLESLKKNILVAIINILRFITAIILIIVILSFILKTNKIKINREKLSTFECGFEPEHKNRSSFSIRFFIISVIFLIFDVEVTVIFPIIVTNNTQHTTSLLINIFLFIILLGGLIFEWQQGSLKWSWKYI